LFLVEPGAGIKVVSTIVPYRIVTPRAVTPFLKPGIYARLILRDLDDQ